ncbi:MAG: low molecular weight phosphatase family protein [Alphaproteobacteria bacterium]|nr:low molecular weight phosphatase family protein [Alphaproteobacteria bacterium]
MIKSTIPSEATSDRPIDKLPLNILFACTHNKIRSPMAEAMMKNMYADHIGLVDSCGMDDGGDIGDGFTIAVMQEIGLNIMDHEPKSFADISQSHFDMVICFSEASYEDASRMMSLAGASIEYWPVYDMALIAEGREARLNAYRNVRDDIKTMLNDRFKGLNA